MHMLQKRKCLLSTAWLLLQHKAFWPYVVIMASATTYFLYKAFCLIKKIKTRNKENITQD